MISFVVGYTDFQARIRVFEYGYVAVQRRKDARQRVSNKPASTTCCINEIAAHHNGFLERIHPRCLEQQVARSDFVNSPHYIPFVYLSVSDVGLACRSHARQNGFWNKIHKHCRPNDRSIIGVVSTYKWPSSEGKHYGARFVEALDNPFAHAHLNQPLVVSVAVPEVMRGIVKGIRHLVDQCIVVLLIAGNKKSTVFGEARRVVLRSPMMPGNSGPFDHEQFDEPMYTSASSSPGARLALGRYLSVSVDGMSHWMLMSGIGKRPDTASTKPVPAPRRPSARTRDFRWRRSLLSRVILLLRG